MTPPNPDYPAQLEIDYPPKLSRPMIFIKWLLAIPHYIAVYALGIVAFFVIVIAFFAVLITGRYPPALFDFLVGYERWRARVAAYLLLQTDSYPPFTLSDVPEYPVRLQIDHPDRVGRWRPLLHWALVIPAALVAAVIVLIAYVAVILAWFAILFTGRYPQPLFNAVTVGLRWTLRVTVYAYWMVDRYPPFVWA